MKRFTETEKWNDPWFRKLKPVQKLFWNYICDRCNHAGFWDPDWEAAEFQIGLKLAPTEDLLSPYAGRINVMPNGKLWLPEFIFFQQKTYELNPKNHSHINIIQALNNEGFESYQQALQFSPPLAPDEGLGRGPGKGKVIVKVEVIDEELPFSSEKFKQAWEDWKQHRKEIKSPLTPRSIKMQFKEFLTIGEDRSITAIEYTIKKGWVGIDEPKARDSRPPWAKDEPELVSAADEERRIAERKFREAQV